MENVVRKKILILVKAYPAISTKYGETVCTAGITDDGKWIRLYPIPFRRNDFDKQFKKYEWIELDVIRNKSDFRTETYRPKNIDLNDLESKGKIKSDRDTWEARNLILDKFKRSNFKEILVEAKDKNIGTSLALYKPKEIIDFVFEEVTTNYNSKTIESLKSQTAQLPLFESVSRESLDNFEVVNKLPFKFSFVFLDETNTKRKMMIEDWETGMLYWNCLIRYNGDNKKACEDVKKKYFYDFALTKDYYFIIGTTKKFHNVAPNPFVIIGDYRPKIKTQKSLF